MNTHFAFTSSLKETNKLSILCSTFYIYAKIS